MMTESNSKVAKLARWLLVALFAQSTVACMSVKMVEPSASIGNLEKLRAANITPAKAGNFTLAPGKPPSMDRGVSGLRGSSLESTYGSFAQQLKNELIVELKSAGLYDDASDVVIEGQLTDSKVDAAIGTGSGRLAARFMIVHRDKKIYDKELAVESTWDSSFMGAIAIPEAMNQYTALYKKLIGKLFDDLDFRAALSKDRVRK